MSPRELDRNAEDILLMHGKRLATSTAQALPSPVRLGEESDAVNRGLCRLVSESP